MPQTLAVLAFVPTAIALCSLFLAKECASMSCQQVRFAKLGEAWHTQPQV